MSAVTISQPDVTLMLDLDGTIREATLGGGLPSAGLDAWLGRPWVETVAEGAGDKVRLMLQDARISGVSAFRVVNQRFPSGLELPVEYSTIRLGGKAGLIVIGKNQATVAELQSRLIGAQQAREQDYWKLRDVETRYRLLFDNSNEAVLVIRAEGLRVVEANLAALRALSLMPGQELLPELPPEERAPFEAMLARVRDQGRAPGIVVHLGAYREAWTLRASLMASDPDRVFLLQLAPLALLATGPAAASDGGALPIDALIERMPDAFVVIEPDGSILRGNPAFLDLIQVATEAGIRGERLGRWLSRPGADLAVLLATLQRHRSVRRFTTTLQGELGSELEVEISATGNAEESSRFIGLLIRDVSRRTSRPLADLPVMLPAIAAPNGGGTESHTLLAALGRMADHLGKTSLPTLVKETVGLVERHYIEEALNRVDGNRTATAELLGLSRQSLYMKLNRYGLDTESQLHAQDHA